MERPLVVGVDGSEESLEAVDWAVQAAKRHSLPLRFVYASKWEHYERMQPSIGSDRPAERVFSDNLLASAEERARKLGADTSVTSVLEAGDPVDVLLRESHEATELVVGQRGHGGIAGMLLGSVGLAVAARAVCPVVVVRGQEPSRRGAFGRVVVGVGEGPDRGTALRYALRKAQLAQCELRVVHCWRRPGTQAVEHSQSSASAEGDRAKAEALLDEVLSAVEGDFSDVRVRREAVEGAAHQALLDAAADADLLVVGARRRHDFLGLGLGRVNHTAVHHASCPVAVVPEQT